MWGGKSAAVAAVGGEGGEEEEEEGFDAMQTGSSEARRH